jgi:hypothetical protein
MKKWYLPWVLSLMLGCGGGVTGPTESPSPPVKTPAAAEVSPSPGLPPDTGSLLSARVKGRICFVTNQTGSTQDIRFRAFLVLDETDPSNQAKQQKLVDSTKAVPHGAVDFPVEEPFEIPTCPALVQVDCGRGEGLLAYGWFRVNEPCPRPTPGPSPTPSPQPTPTPTPVPTPTPSPQPTPSPTPTPCPSPTPPPAPQGICHVSNKGKDGGNYNLQLSFKAQGEGHELHLDSSKFCPPDHLGACSCEKALEDARACGPAPKSWKCEVH